MNFELLLTHSTITVKITFLSEFNYTQFFKQIKELFFKF